MSWRDHERTYSHEVYPDRLKRTELKRKAPLRQTGSLNQRSPLVKDQASSFNKRRPISPATTAQREATPVCIVTGARRDEGWTVDPAHLCSRAHGGCDDPLCCVGLRRDVHDQFDRGEFDLLPYLIAHGRVLELQHALGHYSGDLLGLAARLTGESGFVPERRLVA